MDIVTGNESLDYPESLDRPDEEKIGTDCLLSLLTVNHWLPQNGRPAEQCVDSDRGPQ
jgi:hypothetical protein